MYLTGDQQYPMGSCAQTPWQPYTWEPNQCHDYSYNQNVQCSDNSDYFQPQYYQSQYQHASYERSQIASYEAPRPIYPNLPCHEVQQWDYNSMCYNVDGQPCRYTNVVDLEDFMNNEKRKEKSRVAARCRRTKEMEIFSELTAALPARKEEVEQLDKASVMRLAISYLKVRDMVSLLPNVSLESTETIKNPKGLEEVSSELSYMKALDGFVLVLSQTGDIVYCSENIADHLGISQMDIMGQSVFEFSHPCDHEEIREALRWSDNGRRELLLRLKCTLTSKGRNVHLKSASYKVIHVTGHMLAQPSDKSTESGESKTDEDVKNKNGALVAVGRPIPHPSNIEIPLDSKTFLSKHGLDMKFTYTDETLLKTLGFDTDELVGRSLYDYHHAGDSAQLVHQFKSLFSKGQCETGQYRFLAKRGGYAWVQTQATVITDKTQKPVSVVCVNYIVSGIECRDEVFAAHQVQHANVKRPIPRSPNLPNGAIVAAIPPPEEQPIPVTELIFAPRKKEMNKGFLMFSQDEGLTMLKDEPEDLTHLAPTAGDACIPLENSPFDMFDEFILSDNYCSLLGDDLANGSPVDSLTADSLLMSSPEPQENDSSCEKSSLLTELSLDAFDSGRSDNDIDDGHSPFIPLSDELPILEPAVMWGALPDSVSQARPQPPPDAAPTAPALQRLLAAPPTGPPPQDLITNIYSDQGLIPSRSIPSWDTGTGMKRVMKQEEATNAKRVKRSPSPVQGRPQSSSVLMNLLDLPEPPPQRSSQLPYQTIVTAHKPPPKSTESINIPSPVPIASLLQAAPSKSRIPDITFNNIHSIRSNELQIVNNMSPLTLNVNSPMYSLPSSPNYITSPAISPNTYKYRNNRATSPYSPSLSPQSYQNELSPPLVRGRDPYMTNKMQPSPDFPQSNDNNNMLIDSTMPMLTNDFWNDNEMMQDNADLLTAFDDVKLI